ncbi:CHAD domain-containing protein [Thioalkalivibrio sp. XN279]|uniref:CHAD domain-containing protein n=1 Tax=Thioalkalivibrio sp. XN279 TaxID=2714953 RepID=UPI00140D7EDC|nr:CHAD domain-containing protein [Thioalkalivibrio sp. XN279]NHA13432.1 CHAD domain-containing protein [Thioalkalivibrio sp. XN279]
MDSEIKTGAGAEVPEEAAFVAAENAGGTISALLDRSIARLEDAALPPAWVVHEVRKDLKRTRAMLRLCEQELSTRAAEKRCGAAARALSHLRDADAAQETVSRLRPRAGTAELHALDELSAWIACQRETRDGSGGLPRAIATQVAESLREVRTGLDTLAFGRMDASALDAGLAATWSDTARAYRRAARKPKIERFHDFRKAVKRELYQRELCGRPLERMERATLKKLADVLGELQDLEVLHGTVRDAGRWRGPLKKLIKRTARELKGRALRLGEGRYARRAS